MMYKCKKHMFVAENVDVLVTSGDWCFYSTSAAWLPRYVT